MFKHSKTLVLMLSWIILQAQTQDWNFGPNNLFEGTQLPHIYSNNIEFGFGPAGVDFSQTYSFTIPENVFSTTENIYIVIGINLAMKVFITSSSATTPKMTGLSLWTEPTPKSMQQRLSSPWP